MHSTSKPYGFSLVRILSSVFTLFSPCERMGRVGWELVLLQAEEHQSVVTVAFAVTNCIRRKKNTRAGAESECNSIKVEQIFNHSAVPTSNVRSKFRSELG